MEFRQLHYFCAIAEEKNFTKAAKRLFVAQPAVSQSIAQLEKELGVPLLTRMPRSVKLTGEGEYFYKYAKKALQDRDSVIRNLSFLSNAYGSITISVKTAADIILQLIYSFQEKYPNISIDVTEQKSVQPDLIISNCKDEPDKYDFTFLHSEPFYLLLPKTHPLASLGKVCISDLATETIILDSDYEFNDVFLSYCKAAGFNPPKRRVCPNWTLIPDMVMVYNGYSAVLEISLKGLPDGVVARPLAEDITRTIWLGALRNDYESKAAALFRQYILENFTVTDRTLGNYR